MKTIDKKATHPDLIVLFATLLFIYGWLSVNVYLPALPSLSNYFHTDISNLKFSITLFLFGFAISQFFWGFYSEKHGRKKPLLIGLFLVLLGTFITMVSPNVDVFNIGRFVEALGLGSGPVAGRAALTDLLDQKELTIAMAYATISTNIMPAIAPIIGGNLLHFGWRSIFAFLLLYGGILFAAFWHFLPETSRTIKSDLQIKDSLRHYFEIFKNREYLGYSLPYMIVSGAMIGYYAMTPFIFITHLHISAKIYGFLSLFTVGAYIFGAIINRLVSSFFRAIKIILFGIGLLFLSSVLFLIFAILFSINSWTVLVPISFFTFAAGLICPSCNAVAMTVMRNKAGTASAILSGTLYLGSAIFSAITTSLSVNSLFPLAFYITTITLIVFFQFTLMVVKKERHNAKK